MEELANSFSVFRTNLVQEFNHQCDLFENRIQDALKEQAQELQAVRDELAVAQHKHERLYDKAQCAARMNSHKSTQTESCDEKDARPGETSLSPQHSSETKSSSLPSKPLSQPMQDESRYPNGQAPTKQGLLNVRLLLGDNAESLPAEERRESQLLQDLLVQHPFLQRFVESEYSESTRLNGALKQMTDKARELKKSLLVERSQRIRERHSLKSKTRISDVGTTPEASNAPDASDTASVERCGTAPAQQAACEDSFEVADHRERASSAPHIAPETLQTHSTSQERHPRLTEVAILNFSDSTESNSDPNPGNEAQEDPSVGNPPLDVPEIVSERSLKRKRSAGGQGNAGQVHIKSEIDRANRSVRVKSEYDNLPHPLTRSDKPRRPQDSMDLDEVRLPLITTPPNGQASQESSPDRRQRWQAELNARVPPDLRGAENAKLARQYLHSEVRNGQLEDYVNRKHDAPHQSAILISSDPPEQTLLVFEGTKVAASVAKPTYQGNPDALKPKTPNPRLGPLTTKKGKEDAQVAKQIQAVTEDGERYDAAPRQSEDTTSDARLATLLRSPQRRKEYPALDYELQAVRGPRTESKDPLAIDNPRGFKDDIREAPSRTNYLTSPSTMPRDNRGTEKTRRHFNVSSFDGPASSPLIFPGPRAPSRTHLLPPARAVTRLRERVPAQLDPTDFVLNPEQNSGLDYAFSDVVRRRAERKCLPNCIRPECCGGKFDEFARLGGLLVPQRHSLGNELRSTRRDEDDQLIIDYLGCEPHRIDYMPHPEKADILRKAIPWKFGQEFGRHRHMHERPVSPPGFWRTDMPSTQEMERDRAAAEQLKKRTVEERYREAMRSGGKWKFRDEMARA